MILHTLSALPHSAAFADCLNSAGSTDAIFLLGNGVYCALPDTPAMEQLCGTGAELFIFAEHAQQAGVQAVAETFKLLDMDGFVELTERFSRQVAWH